VLANGTPFDELRVGDIMSDGISTACTDDDLWDTLERMRDLGIRRMPVVDAPGGLIGIVTMDDILAMMAQGMNDMTQIIRSAVADEARQRP
jgi:CBS domain-containing protein